MNNDISAYKDLYFQTAKDYVSRIEHASEQLTTNPDNKEAIDAIHLSAHSLKSQSHAMGYETTAEMFMTIEKVFAKIQNGDIPLNSELLPHIKECVAEFKISLEQIQQSNQEKDMSQYIEQIKRYL